jgi:hypothetical protein
LATASRKNIFLVAPGGLSDIDQHVRSVGIWRSVGEGKGRGGEIRCVPFHRIDIGGYEAKARDLASDRAMGTQFGKFVAFARLPGSRRV